MKFLLVLGALLPCVFSQVSWRTYRNQCLVGGSQTIIDGLTLTECQNECINNKDQLCAAIHYSAALVQCTLINENSLTIQTENPCYVTGVDLYEYHRAETWTTHSGACLGAAAVQIYSPQPFAVLCRELCETEVNFRCSGFNFDYVNEECELTREDTSTRTLLTPCPYGQFESHIRKTDSNWKEFYNSRLNGGTSGASSIEDITIEQCLKECEDHSGFECKGVEYQYTRVPPLCSLLRNNNQTHPITTISTRHYFERVLVSKWRIQDDACVVESARGQYLDYLTENGCMRECERDYDYDFNTFCRSITYDRTNFRCYLHSDSSVVPGHPVGSPCPESNFTYAEKIDDC